MAATKSLVSCGSSWCATMARCASRRLKNRSAPATTGRLVETRRASPGAPFRKRCAAPWRPQVSTGGRFSKSTIAPAYARTTPSSKWRCLRCLVSLAKSHPWRTYAARKSWSGAGTCAVWKADKIAASWSESRASIWETACAATCFSRASASVFRAISALRVSANAEASEGSSAGGTRSQLRATLAMAVNVSAKGSCSFGRKALWMMLSARANLAADSRASAFVASPRRTAKSEASAA
mmetsp:Transcript_8057/g.26386  ORF Transcript_8057/g.26386 Transcript_8057/m.26386 type:complete len:238 (-) Transcript_8057:2019-2732(-)